MKDKKRLDGKLLYVRSKGRGRVLKTLDGLINSWSSPSRPSDQSTSFKSV